MIRARSLLLAAVVFLSAFLLFQVQPLVGKFVLPWFGGGPAVWATCLLFFQTVLLGGYAYAHLVATRLSPRGQVAVQAALLVGALLTLPVLPDDRWKPPDAASPAPRVLAMLAVSVGLASLALAATAPLVQVWFGRLRTGARVYRLYALSNAGSLLALLSYPTLIEPTLTRGQQGIVWSVTFGVFAVLCGGLAVMQAARPRAGTPGEQADGVSTPPAAREGAEEHERPTLWRRALWILLPACGSALLGGITNTLTQDVAPVPLLWVAPLAVYLLTFVLCFDHPRWYRRPIFPIGLIPAAILFAWLTIRPIGTIALAPQVAAYCGVLFVCCMTLHGELFRLRPPPRWLTGYFLAVAAGGAAGGAFVALAAPKIFVGLFEAQWAVFACCALVLLVLATDPASRLFGLRPAAAWFGLVAGLVLLGGMVLTDNARIPGERVLARSRSFYSVLTVAEQGDAGHPDHHLLLRHGRVVHGVQFTTDAERRRPRAYYGPHGGLQYAVDVLRQHRGAGGPLRLGVVGLGVGTLAAYGREGDVVRMYEIDPAVEQIARSHFTYLSDATAKVDVVLGDGRLALEREPNQRFDALVLDAFSSDSVPAHLLTREALEIYTRHLATGGLLAVNASNHFIDLDAVVAPLAAGAGLRGVVIDHNVDRSAGCPVGEFSSRWILLSADQGMLDLIPSAAAPTVLQLRPEMPLWTDERTSLMPVIRRRSHDAR